MNKRSIGDELIEAMKEALAITEGKLAPAATHRIEISPTTGGNQPTAEDTPSTE